MGGNVEGSAKEGNEEERQVVGTPEREKNCQIATSVSKVEESPVFNFLNNLSPIQQIKSTHITQAINPLSFSSIPSVFTSPHVTSLKESRFLRRYQISDPSKPEFSSEEATIVGACKVNTNATDQIDEHDKNLDRTASDSQAAGDQSFDCSKFVAEFKEGPSDAGNSLALVPFVQDTPQRVLHGNEVDTDGASQVDQNNEAASCEWDTLISETSDLFIFESPNCTDHHRKSTDGMSFYGIGNEIQNMHSLCAFGSGEQVGEGNGPEDVCTQPGEGSEIVENSDMIPGPSMTNPNGKNVPGFHRGMRRRCLVYEMAGVRRKRLDENLASDPSILMQSDDNTSSNDQKFGSVRAGNDSSPRCALPGIGLHLNTLAATPNNYVIVNQDSLAPGRLVIGPSSSVSFHPSTTGQELFNPTLPTISSNEEINTAENAIVPMDDAGQGQTSGHAPNEEMNNSTSPKKKRRRTDHAGEGEACKRCNCKKSKCLKLYCECFAAGVYCVEPCACIDCFNKPVHEDTVLATRKQIESRNPLAFAPKVIRGPDSLADTGDDSSKTPASARHKRGCNCKKSGCLKKYCECYQGGVGCSINCRCEGCKNAFGRKDGSSLIPMESEPEEGEADTNEKSEKAAARNDLDQNMELGHPATPLRAVRQSVPLTFSSKKKPPRSSFPSIGSSSGLHARKGLGNPSFQPQPKLDSHVEDVREEMPEFLLGSPVVGVKSTSPNQKRVSPPRSTGMSPGMRSSRKLILQSIPSFPSLSQNQ